MANPLVIGTNSLASVDEVTDFIAKYFNIPGIAAWNALTESDTEYQKSYTLMRASDEVDSLLQTLNLVGTPDITTQRYQYPRDANTPAIIKEAVFLQALYILTFDKYKGEAAYLRSQTIGPLSNAFDTKGLQGTQTAIAPMAYALVKNDPTATLPPNLRIART